MAEPLNKKDTACALYHSRACAILNMRTCSDCPASRTDGNGDRVQTVADYLELFESLLPEGGTAQLFESEACTLCKTEPKGKRSCYAVIDIGHSEPKALHAKKLFSKSEVGFMLPLQFACCKACRRRFLLVGYLPLLIPLVLGAILVPFFVEPHLLEGLRSVAPWFPLLLALVALVGGYGVGKLLQGRLSQRYESIMYFSLIHHPVAEAFWNKGWFPLFGEKRPQPVFTRTRIAYGLGNAKSSVYSGKIPENGEKAD